VCRSRDPHDRRTRCSVWVRNSTTSLLIDAATEHRIQALREGIPHIDAVLFTHSHADHISGVDDLRVYSGQLEGDLPCYGNVQTLKAIRERFGYIFRRTQKGGGKPRLALNPVVKPVTVGGLKAQPIPVWHGRLKILGWRLGGFAYLTDTSAIPEESFGKLKGLEVLVLDALRPQPHATHFNVAQALQAAKRIGARRTWFTHITHLLPHAATNQTLPKDMQLGYDGLTFEVSSEN
jgi:phosphoribosyl 1,2-cyclic phosphate phosphodiesterase